jgi:N-ethylmaleimide reductase
MHTQKKLFTPIQIGPITLKHRVVMPPMSRLRAQWPSGIPSDLQLEYYRQRASEGGLIFTEATAISTSGRGYKGAPGLYSDEQVTGWKRITDAVHAKGGYIFTQLWHAGRTTHIAVTGEEPVTASVDPAYWGLLRGVGSKKIRIEAVTTMALAKKRSLRRREQSAKQRNHFLYF